MSRCDSSFESVWALIEAACLGTITEDQSNQLQKRLRGDAALQRDYLEYCRMHAELRYLCRASATNDAVLDRIASEAEPAPPASGFPDGLYGATTSFFSEQPVLFSYLVATICIAAAVAIGSLVHVSRDHGVNMARDERIESSSPLGDRIKFVGRITGMKDCHWSDPDTQTVVGASVSLDREYALASGLLEITYRSGARVILEGPCIYKIESSAGGLLAQGKLTARIIHQGPAASATGAKPQALFSVHTPTARITDLGTEFGVEVDENGNTTSRVFQGSVRVEAVDGTGSASGTPTKLKAGESVFVKKDKDDTVRFIRPTTPPKFVRRMIEPPKLLDLLDIIAGGNGLGRNRERGIDPVTGKQDNWFLKDGHGYPGKLQFEFQNVAWNRLVDGVFIPEKGEGASQIDSAGHVFDFKCGTGGTIGNIWARAAEIRPTDAKRNRFDWAYSIGPAERYMPEGRGMLCLHACSGITFDLAAARQMYDGARPARFRTVAGLTEATDRFPGQKPYGKADLWVLVDGQVKYSRKAIQFQDGPIEVSVELGLNDRFLTIVSTDAHNGVNFDWVVFGDPVLDMASTESKEIESE